MNVALPRTGLPFGSVIETRNLPSFGAVSGRGLDDTLPSAPAPAALASTRKFLSTTAGKKWAVTV